jgi:ParB family chromosome partitioning protein
MECLRNRQAGYMAAEATKLLKERKHAAICVAPGSFASAEVVDNLAAMGHDIYEVATARLPVEPVKPEPEQFESETGYKAAEESYQTSLQRHQVQTVRIENMIEEGKAQLLVDVSHRKPELRYRIIPETEVAQPEEKDTVEKLRGQDRRNREIAIERAVEDVKRLVRENAIPDVEFQPIEEGLVYYIMLSSLRKENYGMFGFGTHSQPTAEEKAAVIESLASEQKDVIRRNFIVKHLSDTFGDCKQSYLLLEFAALHFPDKVSRIKEQYNEVYKKRHIRIEERIRELQPFTDEQETKGTVTAEPVAESEVQPETLPAEPETGETTFDEPDTDDIPLYPGLPEYARIGEIPEEEDGFLYTVDEEVAA